MPINTQYAIAQPDRSQKYPALQASEYEPREEDEEIFFCLSDKSAAMLSNQAKSLLGLEDAKGRFNKKKETVSRLTNPFRVVFMGRPSLFCLEKKTDLITPLTKGLKLGNGKVSTTRMLFAILCGDSLLLKEDNSVQLFTLRLNGTKTDTLLKPLEESHSKVKEEENVSGSSILHLYSFELIISVESRSSSIAKGESSLTTLFKPKDELPLLLPEELQSITHAVASSAEVMSDLRDPFGLRNKQRQPAAENRHLLKEVMELASEFFPKDDDPEIGFAQRNKWLSESIAERYNVSDSNQLTAAQIADFHTFIKDCVDRAKAPEPTYDDIPF